MSGIIFSGARVGLDASGRSTIKVNAHAPCLHDGARIGDAHLAVYIEAGGLYASLHMTPDNARHFADQLLAAAFHAEQSNAMQVAA